MIWVVIYRNGSMAAVRMPLAEALDAYLRYRRRYPSERIELFPSLQPCYEVTA